MKGMQQQRLCSAAPKSQPLPVFSASSSPNHLLNSSNKFHFNNNNIKTIHSPISPLFSSSRESSVQQNLLSIQESNNEEANKEGVEEEEGFLVVRRPVMVEDNVEGDEVVNSNSNNSKSSFLIDQSLSEFAKKMPIFEPGRGFTTSSKEKPLGVNLELALYRAKVLGRNYRFAEATQLLNKCVSVWPEDGRAYVALGKVLGKQSKTVEARAAYERGCQATQGENPFIWQCWAVLENKMGNIRRARDLFDAATVADKTHIAAWHGWAVLELKQGNVKKARSLLGKALKYCGGNEYVYQTLALLEGKANRIEQARYLFKQATKCNPKSCASWLAWAQLEMQQENNFAARQLFEVTF